MSNDVSEKRNRQEMSISRAMKPQLINNVVSTGDVVAALAATTREGMSCVKYLLLAIKHRRQIPIGNRIKSPSRNQSCGASASAKMSREARTKIEAVAEDDEASKSAKAC
jgi:hypothetical protein